MPTLHNFLLGIILRTAQLLPPPLAPPCATNRCFAVKNCSCFGLTVDRSILFRIFFYLVRHCKRNVQSAFPLRQRPFVVQRADSRRYFRQFCFIKRFVIGKHFRGFFLRRFQQLIYYRRAFFRKLLFFSVRSWTNSGLSRFFLTIVCTVDFDRRNSAATALILFSTAYNAIIL